MRSVSLVRRYGTNVFCPAGVVEACVRARMQSLRAMREELTNFVSCKRGEG